MSYKPILFSTPMVQAIIDGRKTMTRRVITDIPDNTYRMDTDDGKEWFAYFGQYGEGWLADLANPVKPKYQPGDILWVREKWRTADYEYCDGKWSASVERADGTKDVRVFWYDNYDVGIPYDGPYSKTGWRPSIFMPKEAARLFLSVTDVRAERLQEIGLGSCYAEGCPQEQERTPDRWFHALWDNLNAKRGYGWDADCWVWVYTFERIAKPVGWPEVAK